jgi:hypothetical protein
MDSGYIARLRAHLDDGFPITADRVIAEAPGFAWNLSFLDGAAFYDFSAILTFSRPDSLEELVTLEATLTIAPTAKWTMDLVGTSLTVADLRWAGEDRQLTMMGDPEAAADAVLDFFARVRLLIVQELADWDANNPKGVNAPLLNDPAR